MSPGRTATRMTAQVPPDLVDWLESRAARAMTGESVPLRLVSEVRLLRGLLASELNRVPLTVPEASCLADVVGGDMMQPGWGSILLAEVWDAFAAAPGVSSYSAKWGVSQDALIARLRGIGPTADLALRDALSAWWAADGEPTAAGFTAAGLRIIEVG